MVHGIRIGTLACAFATAASAEDLAPGRAPVDLGAIDAAWSEVYDDFLHSGEPLTFSPPSEADIPEGPFGALIRDGLTAFRSPATEARAYVGNRLSCSNCHLESGRKPDAAPMWAAYPVYPQFRSKNDQVNTIEMRIQGCFRFSMNGQPPPADGDLMKSLVAYFAWLSQGAPIGAKLVGRGFPALTDPAAAPSLERGEAVYAQYCAGCHQAQGEGLASADGAVWIFPPVWGPESYNWGAGMHDPSTAAGFIKRNMPYGRQNLLTDQEAWDVAYYINSHERPQDPRFDGDLARTRTEYHKGQYDLYGTLVRGVLLGAPAATP